MRSLAMLCLLACPCAAAAQEQPPPAPPAGHAQQAPKNLKILKPEEVRPAMGMFRASLGVPCSGCHVQGDFASDAKPEKEIARKMILMTRQINANFPAGIGSHQGTGDSVSCYTCHNGASMPKTVPPPPLPGARPATLAIPPPAQ